MIKPIKITIRLTYSQARAIYNQLDSQLDREFDFKLDKKIKVGLGNYNKRKE
jgi:hypothetical protein